MTATMYTKVVKILHKPGRRTEVRGSAPMPDGGAKLFHGDEEKQLVGFIEPVKTRKLDRWLDKVVAFSGSQFAFAAIVVALLTWALLGIKFGHDENWQVIISDVQALLCYIYDSFLTRQQLNAHEDDAAIILQLQSRGSSHLRMLARLKEADLLHGKLENSATRRTLDHEPALKTPKESLYTRFSAYTSVFLGHPVTLAFFWIGIIIWLSIGSMFSFSNSWQLYMNSATSALMVFTFGLIANIRERHGEHTKICLDHLLRTDSSLELRLRFLSADALPNPEVVLPAPRVGKIQRAIFYYADFVGTLVGIIILFTVVAAWLAVGPALHFDSNWWLLIGTYAGLIGMFDGFVLRNMQSRLRSFTDEYMATVNAIDEQLFALTNTPCPPLDPSANRKQPLATRLSQLIDRLTSHPLAVVAALLFMLGLLAGSCAMKWSLTGQLLSNVPPSIVEAWLMMVLLTGHNLGEEKKRAEITALWERRVQLRRVVENVPYGIANVADGRQHADKA